MKRTLLLVSLAAAAAALATTACKQSEAKKGVGIDLANIDSSAAPGNDFFQFANGSWIKANPIPNDQSRWGTFNILGDNNRKNLRGLAEEAAAKTGAAKGSPEQMVGDFWFTAMDTVSIEKAGAEPIKGDMSTIDGLKDMKSVLEYVSRL